MLSIDNTYNEADVREFDTRVRRWLKGARPEYVVEPKIGGVSVALLYEEDRLVLGATRNDHHPGPEILEVRGEAYMTHTEMSRLNRLQGERGQRLFANARNAAAGSLELLDPRLCARRRLRFFAHTEGRIQGSLAWDFRTRPRPGSSS